MSYFAKPNFIVYDEWFDDLKEEELDIKEKKIKTISNIHEFFYRQSNYKVGASENNLQLDIKVNQRELFNNKCMENTSEKYSSLSNKRFWFFKKLTKSKLKFNLKKKIIYSLSIFSFLVFFGYVTVFISTSRKNESNISNQFFSIEK